MSSPDAGRPTRRRRWPIVVAVVATLAVALGVAAAVLALSARSAYAELSAARDALLSARTAIGETDIPAAQSALDEAATHATAAVEQTGGPLWSVAAAVPIAGATPEAVRAVATSLDQALSGLAPAVDELRALTPENVIDAQGTINLVALEDAAPDLRAAQAGLASAAATIAAAPSKADGDLVIAQVDAAVTQMREQLAGLEDAFGTANDIAGIAPELLGIDGPKRYLVGITNPNEARGTGGFLGTYVILRADEGQITVEQVGSNSDIPQLPYLPVSLGEDYLARYGSDPALVGNMNISPHFPAAATLWTEGWYQATGETLDGAFAADVVALGDLVTATGQEVPLPDGASLTGEELTEFAISGIYEKFPEAGDSPERKAYQEQVTAAAFELVTASPERRALAEALGTGLTARRVLLWSADEATQALLASADVAGSLKAPDGHTLDAVAINYSASKLDAYLERRLTYEVGRCADGGRVTSRATFALTNAIPEGADVPEYVMSQAERGPDGPINKTMAQLHLPNGAQITSVTLDGEPIVAYTFSEQGRPSVIHGMDLDPRVERTLVVEFTEPADPGPATVIPQPLAIDQVTTVVDAPCAGPAGLPTPS